MVVVVVVVVVVVGLLVPNRNFKDFSLLSVDFKHQDCPSARGVSAASVMDNDVDTSTIVYSMGVRSELI